MTLKYTCCNWHFLHDVKSFDDLGNCFPSEMICVASASQFQGSLCVAQTSVSSLQPWSVPRGNGWGLGLERFRALGLCFHCPWWNHFRFYNCCYLTACRRGISVGFGFIAQMIKALRGREVIQPVCPWERNFSGFYNILQMGGVVIKTKIKNVGMCLYIHVFVTYWIHSKQPRPCWDSPVSNYFSHNNDTDIFNIQL